MTKSELDIYQDLFAKIQENRDTINIDDDLEIFEVFFTDGDTVLEEWVRNFRQKKY